MITLKMAADLATLYAAFKNTDRDINVYEHYFSSRQQGHCEILIAENQEQKIMGHAILLWVSRLKPHALEAIPEIMDVYTHPQFRGQQVAKTLVQHCENLVLQYNQIKIGLGALTVAEFKIHSLYLKLGYAPVGLDYVVNQQVVVYEKKLRA